MKKVLVTGGCGLIGDKVCSGLLKKGFYVIAVDRNLSDYNKNKDNFEFYQAAPNDKEKYSKIFEKEEIDALVHLACSVDNDFPHIVEDDEINTTRACNKFIFKLALVAEVKQCILLSTSQVYETPKSREPVREEDDIKITTNYAKLKFETEQSFVKEFRGVKDVSCAILRCAPIYTKDYYENLLPKIYDFKEEIAFVYRTGEYGFQFCCLHNLADFILCFMRHADDPMYTGVYNVADKNLTSASEIIQYMKDNHRLGPVIQRKEGFVSSVFSKLKSNKEEKINYRYLDTKTMLNNYGIDISKASRICPLRWDIHNTK